MVSKNGFLFIKSIRKVMSGKMIMASFILTGSDKI